MSTESPIPCATAPAAAPEVTPPLPFALPPDLTKEQAQQRIHELQQDKAFGARWLKNGNDSNERRVLDALQRRAMAAPKAAPKAEPDPVRPPGPPSASAYVFSPVLATSEATAQAAEARSLAFAHGLTTSEFTSIAEQQQKDLARFAGWMTK